MLFLAEKIMIYNNNIEYLILNIFNIFNPKDFMDQAFDVFENIYYDF